MAKIRIGKKDFEKHLKLDEQMIKKVSMLGIPVDDVGNELELEVFSNRPDLLSIYGISRAVNSFTGKNPGLKEYKINPPGKNFKVIVEKSVKTVRPYTTCAIIKNLSLNEDKLKEIISLQEKLHLTIGRNRKKTAIGIYPLDKIAFPIKYAAKKPSEIKFIPLGMEKEQNATQILKNHPAGKEYSHLLSENKEFPIFIDSKKNILSMPPIINSNEIGKVTEGTTNLFIECSGFDLEILQKTLNIIVTILAEMGGDIYQVEIQDSKKFLSPDLTPSKMKVSIEKANKLLGLSLQEADLKKLLPLMGYSYKNKEVIIPAWRTDILHEVDIIEDIAIAYGYENIKPEKAEVSTTGELSKETKICSKIAEVLIGLGLTEISSYHLVKKEEAEAAQLKQTIEVENSKTEYKLLRSNLLIPCLRVLSENKDNEYPQNLFEIGKIFRTDERQESGLIEKIHLILSFAPGNFTFAKQNLDSLFKSLSLNYSLRETSRTSFIDGRTGLIMLDKNKIGYIGEVHPKTLKDWGIKVPLSVIEINLTELINKLS